MEYELCVYDAALGLVLEARAGSEPACGGRRPRSCWKETRRGFTFADRRAPAGLSKVSLKSGPSGRAQAAVQGKGPALRMPALPLAAPIVVQLRNVATGACWSAILDDVVKARRDQLKAIGR
jgi:hypothetical protein